MKRIEAIPLLNCEECRYQIKLDERSKIVKKIMEKLTKEIETEKRKQREADSTIKELRRTKGSCPEGVFRMCLTKIKIFKTRIVTFLRITQWIEARFKKELGEAGSKND